MSEELGSYAAKTRLPEILRRVDHGESFTITIHGRAIADIVPSTQARKERARVAIANLLAARKHPVSDRDLVSLRDSGRK